MSINAMFSMISIMTIAFFIISCDSGSGNIQGKIELNLIEHIEGKDLGGTTIKVKGRNETAATDKDGKFTLKNLDAGTYTLTISRDDWDTKEAEAKVTGGKVVEFNEKLDYSFAIMKGYIELPDYSGEEATVVIKSEAEGKEDVAVQASDTFSFTRLKEGSYKVTVDYGDISAFFKKTVAKNTLYEEHMTDINCYTDSDDDGFMDNEDFILDFEEISNAEINIHYVSDAKKIRVNSETSTAIAKTDEGTIVLNGTDSGLKEVEVKNNDDLAVKLMSPAEYIKSVSANVSVEIKMINGTAEDRIIEGVFKITSANMVLVTSGTTSSDNGSVMVDHDYYVSIYEVTFEEYDRFVSATGGDLIDDWGWGRDRKPVRRLSWYDAVKYANWLSEQKGFEKVYSDVCYTDHTKCDMDIIKKGYRLPTAEEWEYSARGGKNGKATTYSGSDDIDDVAWYSGNSGSPNKPQDVGTKDPNELGIYDMSGNVAEWNFDVSDSSSRIYQGGSFDSDPAALSKDFYDAVPPESVFDFLGFRLVRTK